MVDSLVHISNIAMMEHRLPKNEVEQQNTLWEGDELTVRFMLEEGKLNLCLRMMHEYCRQRYDPGLMADGGYRQWLKNTAADLAHAAPESKLDAEAVEGRILTFEQGMGVLLRCAFEHVEAVQTTDLPELIEHATEVLRACSQAAPGSVSLERTQPALLLRYLASIMLRVSDEKIPEDKVSGCGGDFHDSLMRPQQPDAWVEDPCRSNESCRLSECLWVWLAGDAAHAGAQPGAARCRSHLRAWPDSEAGRPKRRPSLHCACLRDGGGLRPAARLLAIRAQGGAQGDL